MEIVGGLMLICFIGGLWYIRSVNTKGEDMATYSITVSEVRKIETQVVGISYDTVPYIHKMKHGDEVAILPDYDNQFDETCLSVSRILKLGESGIIEEREHVGYLDKELASIISDHINSSPKANLGARVESISGGTVHKPAIRLGIKIELWHD